MKNRYLQKFIFVFLMVLSTVIFSISNAQHMFFHLLPGFVPAYTWVGLGSDANWNTAANWSTGVVPGPSNTAIFNDICVSNCNPMLNIAVNILGFDIKASYAGTITQAAGQTMTIGAGGWTQAGGQFVGSDANIQISGVTTLSGTSAFTSTSGTLEFKNAATIPSAVFTHNAGTVDLTLSCLSVNFNLGTQNLNHFRIIGNCGTVNLQASTITVIGNFTLSDTNGGILNNGTVNVEGNVTLGAYGSYGTAWVRLTGGNAQTITNADVNQDRPKLPFFEIAKNAGTVATFNGRMNLTKDYLYTSGDINMGTSMWAMVQDCSTRNVRPGNWNYPDVLIAHSCGTLDLGGQTLKVTGLLTLSSSFAGMFANGTIEAYADVTQTGIYGLYDATPATATLKIIGAGNQTITGGAGRFPKTEIASTGGTVILNGTLTMMSDYTHTTGTVNAGTSTLAFIGNAMITPSTVNYYNVTFGGDNKTQNLNAGAMNVSNILTFADTNAASGSVNNGSINASGNVVFSSYGKVGTAVLNYTGTASTTLTVGATAQTLATTHNVAKTGAGTVALVANTSFASAGRNFTITSGTFNVAGFTFGVNSLLTISTNGRFLCNGGTATAGSWAITGQISCGSGQGITWTGNAGDNLWSTATNWTNNTVPAASDVALFNASVCVGAACNAQVNSNLSVRGINLQSTYTGTLTQNSTRTLTVGAAGFQQDAGNFVGGNSAMVLNGSFTLNGGNFTATSGLTTAAKAITVGASFGTFTHNSGNFLISAPANQGAFALVPQNIVLNNLEITGDSTGSGRTLTGILKVAGNLTLNSTTANTGLFNGGTIEVSGNVIATNSGLPGTVLIKLVGGLSQTLTGSAGAYFAFFPALEIASTGGTVTFTGYFDVMKSFTMTSGAVDMGTSSVRFNAPANQGAFTITPGSINFYNVELRGDSTGSGRTISGTIKVLGTLTLNATTSNPGLFNGGTVEAYGNVTALTSGCSGTTLFKVIGSGAQTITGAALAWFPNLEIASTGGTVTFSGTLSFYGNYTYTSGVVDAGTSTMHFAPANSSSASYIVGPVSYNNVTFAGNYTTHNLNAGTMTVLGTLTLADVNGSMGNLNSGTINLSGNLVASNVGKVGTAVIRLVGSTNQSITGTSAAWIPTLEIASTGGTVTLSGSLLFRNSYTYTSGTVDPGTSTLIFTGTPSTTHTHTFGPWNYNVVTFGGNITHHSLNSGTLNVLSTLTFSDVNASSGNINSGTINASGNISFANYGKNGSAILNMTGSTNTTLTVGSTARLLGTTQVIAKTGGAQVSLVANTSYPVIGQDFTITSGTLNLAGFDFSVNDVLSIGAAGSLICNGGEFTAGTLSNSGTINCPGYSTYDFNWTGAGGNANWTTAGNWQGGVAPGLNDIVVFQDTYCGANCNSTISMNQNAKGVRLFSPYTGTITQAASAQLFIGSRGYTQAAGTFLGGNDSFSVGTKFILTGGTFTSTSGQIQTDGTTWNTSGGTFNPNNGTMLFSPSTVTVTINHGANTFHNLNVYGWGTSYTTTGTVTVNNDFNFGTGSGSGTSLTGGAFALKGNVTMVNNGLGSSTASTIFRIDGTGAQTFTGTGGYVTALEINKPSGTLNLTGTIIENGVLNYVTGTVNPGTSTFRFLQLNGTTTHSPNGLTLANVYFDHAGTNANINFNNQTLNTTGTVTFNSTLAGAALNSGTLTISGNAVKSGTTAVGGTAAVQFIGSTNSTITPSGTNAFPGNTTINKSGGATVTLAGNSFFNNAGQNLTITSGTIDMAGFNLTVGNNISNSGTLRRGTNPTCGTITQGGSYSGNASVCP